MVLYFSYTFSLFSSSDKVNSNGSGGASGSVSGDSGSLLVNTGGSSSSNNTGGNRCFTFSPVNSCAIYYQFQVLNRHLRAVRAPASRKPRMDVSMVSETQQRIVKIILIPASSLSVSNGNGGNSSSWSGSVSNGNNTISGSSIGQTNSSKNSTGTKFHAKPLHKHENIKH